MAAAWSRKRPLAKNVVDSIAIGDKVRRHFSTHELQAGTPTSQCVDGIVTGSQTGRGRGKKSKEIWWSVRFDAPVPYPLLCSTNDVAEMKICFHEHRDKWAALDKDIGKDVWKKKMIISVVILVGVEIWSKKTIFQHRFK